jgi:hypothetical protein
MRRLRRSLAARRHTRSHRPYSGSAELLRLIRWPAARSLSSDAAPLRRQRSTPITVLVRIYLAAETLRLEIENPGAAGALASNGRDLEAEASASSCSPLAGR